MTRLVAALSITAVLLVAFAGFVMLRHTSEGTMTVLAAGDVACDPEEPAYADGKGTTAGCQQRAVGEQIRAQNPDAFLALGDLQYVDGTYEKFMQSYDPALGDLKPITFPIPGNHEYQTPHAVGYYLYFGDRAHPESRGTYSFNPGDWHVVAINSIQCTPPNRATQTVRWAGGSPPTSPRTPRSV